MITGELKSKVDSIWNTMWSGGISNPLSVIEQLTYLLFIKRLDEVQTLKEAKANRTGKPIEEPVFAPGQDHLRWSHFKELAPEQMFERVRDEVFPFIKSLGKKPDAEGEQASTYTHHMKDALFMMPTARVLANVVDQLDEIDMADRDTKGDLYEYMLGKIASAGQNGQFRTPRHIIKLMVEMTAPTPPFPQPDSEPCPGQLRCDRHCISTCRCCSRWTSSSKRSNRQARMSTSRDCGRRPRSFSARGVDAGNNRHADAKDWLSRCQGRNAWVGASLR